MKAKRKKRTIDLTGDFTRWAREGRVDVALELCRWASDSLWKGKKLRPIVAGYFARALERIGNGEDPNKALHLIAPAKRPREDERNCEIAIDYFKKIDAGKKPKTAKMELSKFWGFGEKNVKRIERIVGGQEENNIRREIEFRKLLKTANPVALKIFAKRRLDLIKKGQKA